MKAGKSVSAPILITAVPFISVRSNSHMSDGLIEFPFIPYRCELWKWTITYIFFQCTFCHRNKMALFHSTESANVVKAENKFQQPSIFSSIKIRELPRKVFCFPLRLKAFVKKLSPFLKKHCGEHYIVSHQEVENAKK